MADCRFVTKEMLNGPLEVRVDDPSLDFFTAKSIADGEALSRSSDPMLVSWFDRKTGHFSPDVVCCGTERPSWLVYAQSRGASISVDINDEEYVFVYV
jgi:hypothetical protein